MRDDLRGPAGSLEGGVVYEDRLIAVALVTVRAFRQQS